MKQLFLPYELALIAKEKGFDEQCLAYYGDDKEVRQVDGIGGRFHTSSNAEIKDKITAPLYQQIINWFIKEYRIKIRLIPTTSGYDWYEIWIWNKDKVLWNKHIIERTDNLNQAISEAFKLI